MSISNFNAEVWAAQILVNLRKAHVAAGVVNRDYEGEISSYGEKVRINNIQAITSKDYSRNSDIDAPDTLDGDDRTLDIDQAKYINFQVDDVDAAQQRPKVMNEAMNEAAHSLADEADTYILGLHGDFDSGNFLGTTSSPETFDASTAYGLFVEAGQNLRENNVPTGNWWAIVTPWMLSQIVKSDEFIKTGTGLGDTTVTTGMVGEMAGFRILVSNNVPDPGSSDAAALFSYPGAITHADQILDMEAYRPERRFADAVKGLYVFGSKVIRPSAGVVGYFSKPT